MKEFIGQFHPLFVHLPIGFLVLAFTFFILRKWRKLDIPVSVIQWALIFSALATVGSAVTGLVLADGGGYDSDLVQKHRNGGLALLIVNIVLWWLYFKKKEDRVISISWMIAFLLLTLTGHWGGSLTHGEDFLSLSSDEYVKPEISDPQQALVYAEIIEPIFAEKCWSCHSSKKKKGELRLDGMEFILKGGESGEIVKAHQAGESDLYKRLLLEKDDDEHMPPDGKPQLTKNEIMLVEWWISSGLTFDKKAGDLEQLPAVKSALASLIASGPTAVHLPDVSLSQPDLNLMKQLQDAGFSVSRVAADSPFLTVSLFNRGPSAEGLKALKSLSKHVIWFKASDIEIGKELTDIMSGFENLMELEMKNCKVSVSLESLSGLERLEKLNLSSSPVPASGVKALLDLPLLTSVYLFETGIKPEELPENKKIIWGHFEVPVLESDTVEFTRNHMKA